MDIDPHSLDLKGSTQPELFRGTIDAMVLELKADAAKFWPLVTIELPAPTFVDNIWRTGPYASTVASGLAPRIPPNA